MCLSVRGAAGWRVIPSTSGSIVAGCYVEGETPSSTTGGDSGGDGRISRSRIDDHIQRDDAVATCGVGENDGLLSCTFDGGSCISIGQLIAA